MKLLISLLQRKDSCFRLRTAGNPLIPKQGIIRPKSSFVYTGWDQWSALRRQRLASDFFFSQSITCVFILTFSIYFGFRLHKLCFKLSGIPMRWAALSAIRGSLHADLQQHFGEDLGLSENASTLRKCFSFWTGEKSRCFQLLSPPRLKWMSLSYQGLSRPLLLLKRLATHPMLGHTQ